MKERQDKTTTYEASQTDRLLLSVNIRLNNSILLPEAEGGLSSLVSPSRRNIPTMICMRLNGNECLVRHVNNGNELVPSSSIRCVHRCGRYSSGLSWRRYDNRSEIALNVPYSLILHSALNVYTACRDYRQ